VIDSAFNYLAMALTFLCVVLVFIHYRMTRARAVLYIAFGFLWWAVEKVLIRLHVTFVDVHSRALTCGLAFFMALGFYLFIHDMRSFYSNGNGKSLQAIADKHAEALEAAELVKLAADTAAKAIKAAADATAAALAAKEHAAETRALAEALREHIAEERRP
jgi:hypothetical protein